MAGHSVTVKLTATEAAVLAQLVDMAAARSASDALRAALLLYARWWKVKPETLRQIRLERMTQHPRRRGRRMHAGRDNRPPAEPLDPGRIPGGRT